MQHVLLAVHGLSIRDSLYAEPLFKRVENFLIKDSFHSQVSYVSAYWGDIAEAQLIGFRQRVLNSPVWKQLWYQPLREDFLLPFLGDLALYTSRHSGIDVCESVCSQILEQLSDNEISLHLVTHSWGTVILFDLLFADRWNSTKSLPIKKLRQRLRSEETTEDTNIKVASITTMGSPVAFFNLLRGSHGITEQIKSLVAHSEKVIWNNFMHPGDPFVCPLNDLFDGLEIEDHILDTMLPFANSLIALIGSPRAHTCYWSNSLVARSIAETIST